MNYPLSDYAQFLPNLPTKIYNDTRLKEGEFSDLRLPNEKTSEVSLNCIVACLRQQDMNRPLESAASNLHYVVNRLSIILSETLEDGVFRDVFWLLSGESGSQSVSQSVSH